MSDYSKRLHKVIPGGAHTYSRGDDQFPAIAPSILERGEGAYVWDPASNRYLDYGMALRAVTLGYSNARVNDAAYQAILKGNNLTRASLIELEAAELLVDIIPSVDMVKFAKNGSNATTAALKIARAYTGKRYVCVPRQHPFFSFDDWFIGVTSVKRGVLANHVACTLVFDYGDPASLEKLFEEYSGQIAAVMLEPATTITPCAKACQQDLSYQNPCNMCPNIKDNFLHTVQKICRQNEALFILDEMITGFRWSLQGAQSYFGVEPDICTFGKGMANGFAVAAVAGRREVMQVGSINDAGMERTFLLSSTHGGEMSGLAAFIETVAIYREQNVCGHLWDYGQRLCDSLQVVAKECEVSEFFLLDGPAICLNYLTLDATGKSSLDFRTLFSQEMVKEGVLMPWISVSLSHGDEELQLTLNAAKSALSIYRKALDEGVETYLKGHSIKPVFRQYN